MFIRGANQSDSQKSILIVHSYNQGFTWTDQLHKGITEGLDNTQFTIYTEYLDAYRQDSINPNKLAILQTYSEKDLLCIVVTDNPAYETILTLRDDFFPNVPILFAGLNGFAAHDIPDKYITGIAQNTSFNDFFDWISTQMPHIKTVVVCGANTGTTQGVMRAIDDTLALHPYDFSIELVTSSSYEEELAILNTYDKDTTLLYVAGAFGVLNHDQYTSMLSTNTNLPTFCGVLTSIVGNVIGGYVVDPYDHGKLLNEYILKLNKQVPIEKLSFIEEPVEKVVFNYDGLDYHNLLSATLPKDALVFNHPNSGIVLSKTTITILGVIFAFLLLILIALLTILRITKRSHIELEKVNMELVENKMELTAFSEELVASQEELTHQYNIVVSSSKKIQHLIDYDEITGLYNDIKFYALLEEQFPDTEMFSFLYLSIANLDSLTFTHGKSIYEKLLQDVTEFLRETFDENDLLGITSNKHFLIATKHTIEEDSKIIHKISHYFSTPHYNDMYTLLLEYKLGISVYPSHSKSKADISLFSSLAITSILNNPMVNISFYNESIQQAFIYENKLHNEIELALLYNQFTLYYQPKYALNGTDITGLEALIRWNYPDHSVKSPGFFIESAEQSGQIINIGYWVIESVCKTLVQMGSVLSNIPISLNLSGQHFTNKEIIYELTRITQKYGVLPSSIEIEITETSLVTNQAYCSMLLTELRGLGYKIALDDFGTGYASISYIKDFPIDRIKIDQSFTKKITHPKYETLIKTMIQLAQELDFLVTIEGVETQEQYAIIKKYVPQELQGYLFSRPVPIEEIKFNTNLTPN